MNFVELVKSLLVEERGHSQEESDRLVKSYPHVVQNGIMDGLTFSSVRSTAIALEIADSGSNNNHAGYQDTETL